MSAYSSFYFKPAKGERIETKIQVEPEESSAIHGVVLDREGKPIDRALVLLFRSDEEEREINLVSQLYTDADGHFVFGELEGDVLYLIKVFKNNMNIRQLELRA